MTCSHSSSSILHEARLGQHFPPPSQEQPLLDPSLPGIGNGLPADGGDELDGEGFLLGVDVSVVCRDKDSESPCRHSVQPSSAQLHPQVSHTSLNGLEFFFLTSHAWDSSARCVGAGGHSIHLGFHMVGHIVGCASEWDFPDRPRGVIGQVGRQDTDPQLSLGVQ